MAATRVDLVGLAKIGGAIEERLCAVLAVTFALGDKFYFLVQFPRCGGSLRNFIILIAFVVVAALPGLVFLCVRTATRNGQVYPAGSYDGANLTRFEGGILIRFRRNVE